MKLNELQGIIADDIGLLFVEETKEDCTVEYKVDLTNVTGEERLLKLIFGEQAKIYEILCDEEVDGIYNYEKGTIGIGFKLNENTIGNLREFAKQARYELVEKYFAKVDI